MGQSELVPTSSELMEYPDPADAALARMVDHPTVVLAIGRKGGGKTAVILRMQELMRDVAPPYAIGLPEKASRLLPEWYGLADDLEDIPENATVYFPEVVEAARVAFAGVGPHCKKKAVWVSSDSGGQLMENALPTFWSDKLSRIFGDAGPASKSDPAKSSGSTGPSGAKHRKALTTPTAVKKAEVLKLRQAGHSLS